MAFTKKMFTGYFLLLYSIYPSPCAYIAPENKQYNSETVNIFFIVVCY